MPLMLFPSKYYNSKNQVVYVMVVSVMNEELFIEVQVTLKDFFFPSVSTTSRVFLNKYTEENRIANRK